MTPQPLSRTALLAVTLGRLLAGVVVIGGMLFIPAGTLGFWQAWAWLGVTFAPVVAIGIVLLIKDPELLERRMRTRERETPQKKVIAAFILILVVMFVLPGLDRRFGWSAVPTGLVVLSDLLILLGLGLFVLTIRENRYASRVIEVQEEQVVVSSGPYSVVRHPMYLAMTLVLFFSPLALGSYWALLTALPIPFLLALRIRNEEDLLRQGLPGYAEYAREVRHRLVPFLW